MPAKLKMLFLDDRSKRIHAALKKYSDVYDVTIVTNATECLRLISNEEWDVISLDHDLGGKEFTSLDDPNSGMAVVRYIYNTRWPWPMQKREHTQFIIHSSNQFVAPLMADMLHEIAFSVKLERFIYDE